MCLRGAPKKFPALPFYKAKKINQLVFLFSTLYLLLKPITVCGQTFFPANWEGHEDIKEKSAG